MMKNKKPLKQINETKGAMLSFVAVVPTRVLAGGTGLDINSLLCQIDSFAKTAGFIGLIAGLMYVGVSKILEIFFPQMAGPTRDYIKKGLMGVAFIALAVWGAEQIFGLFGITTEATWCNY